MVIEFFWLYIGDRVYLLSTSGNIGNSKIKDKEITKLKKYFLVMEIF
jgi:hypothetical protein